MRRGYLRFITILVWAVMFGLWQENWAAGVWMGMTPTVLVITAMGVNEWLIVRYTQIGSR